MTGAQGPESQGPISFVRNAPSGRSALSFFQRSTPHYLTGECVLSLCLGLRTVQTVESSASSAIMSTTRFLRVQPLHCRSLRTWQTFSGFPLGERKKVEAQETTCSSSWAPAGSGCEAQGAGTSAISGRPARLFREVGRRHFRDRREVWPALGHSAKVGTVSCLWEQLVCRGCCACWGKPEGQIKALEGGLSSS